MEASTQKPTDDLAVQYIAARNQELEERSQLFVARHKGTGLYATRLKSFLQGCEGWRESAKPTVEEVLEEIALAATRAPMWTSDLQDAEMWDRYYIGQFQQFAPNVEFTPVKLSAV
jgi:AMMECR1 domain-containing protein